MRIARHRQAAAMSIQPDRAGPTSPASLHVAGHGRVRHARWSTAFVFLLTGVIMATWASRIPAIKADLGLSDGQLAIAFTSLNAGAVLGLQLGALLVTRIGSRFALLLALPTFAAMLVPVALGDTLLSLAATVAIMAVANSTVDVAMNDQGVAVEHRYDRPLMSGFHAMHPLGGIVGGGIAALAARAGVPLLLHFAAVALVTALAALVVTRRLLPPGRPHGTSMSRERVSPLHGWTPRLALLGALAFAFSVGEGGGLDWSAVLLRDAYGASASLAAIALTIFLAGLTVGRLAGDGLVARFGPVRVFRCGAVLAGGSFAAGLLIGTPASALGGLALLGLGLATLLPLCISTAGTDDRVPIPVAVARVSMVGYLGSFVGPSLIGLLAAGVGLASAMLLPAGAIAATALAAGAVRTSARQHGLR